MNKLLTVRIDSELHQKAKLATIAQETTIADVVRDALRAYVQKVPAAKGPKAAKPAARKAAKPAAKKAPAKKAPAAKPAARKAPAKKAAPRRRK